jgi:predicted N-acetyltransferase YhbS
MYVAPAARGRGISRAILDQLLQRARGLGYTRVRLETGNQQFEAIALYASAGFQPIPCWGPFMNDPKSLCFELQLFSRKRAGAPDPGRKARERPGGAPESV